MVGGAASAARIYCSWLLLPPRVVTDTLESPSCISQHRKCPTHIHLSWQEPRAVQSKFWKLFPGYDPSTFSSSSSCPGVVLLLFSSSFLSWNLHPHIVSLEKLGQLTNYWMRMVDCNKPSTCVCNDYYFIIIILFQLPFPQLLGISSFSTANSSCSSSSLHRTSKTLPLDMTT